jgi:D-beta-D-heptose 7-phosphate kinase/D-beta-D-heptose 1-phosphate adenosyltransferase
VGRVVSLNALAGIVRKLKRNGRRIVTTNGVFDILHIGHVRALQKAGSFGDVLVVGINSDSSVRKYKDKRRPVIGERERAELLAALECVDYVTIFSEPDPCRFIGLVKPDVHVKSGDYDAEKMIETPVVRRHGGVVKIIPYINGFSTTNIINNIRRAYAENN